jgi:uncharacterized Zn-finger protein
MAKDEQRIRRACPYCSGRSRQGKFLPKNMTCTYCWDRGWILEYKPK